MQPVALALEREPQAELDLAGSAERRIGAIPPHVRYDTSVNQAGWIRRFSRPSIFHVWVWKSDSNPGDPFRA
jgi:hypothetical protein